MHWLVFLAVLALSFQRLLSQDEFDCPQLPPLSSPARNVYELRPQDIKVVMALGDSVTAGEAHRNDQSLAAAF